jgi:hypothetical protein
MRRPKHDEARLCSFPPAEENLHVRHRRRRTFLPSWGSQDRDSSKNINSLSFSIKSMLKIENHSFLLRAANTFDRLLETESFRKMALKSIPMCKGPSCRRIKWYISDNSLLYPRCHACSIEPSLVDNLLWKCKPPVCRRQRNDVKRGTEKCAFKSYSDNIKFSKYQSAFLR